MNAGDVDDVSEDPSFFAAAWGRNNPQCPHEAFSPFLHRSRVVAFDLMHVSWGLLTMSLAFRVTLAVMTKSISSQGLFKRPALVYFLLPSYLFLS